MKAGGQPREEHGAYRLWVHCPGLLESQLTEYFSQFGSVVDIYLPRDRHHGARKSFGFATFANEEGLRNTLAAGSEHMIAGKTVRINLAGPRPDLPLPYLAGQGLSAGTLAGQMIDVSALRPGPNATLAGRGSGPRIYVGGIPTAVSETMVRNHFTQWGQVVDVYFPKDKHLNKRKNFCFVTFATQQAAEKAAAQSDREINGYRIESISITHDRQVHYQRQAMTASQAEPQVQNSIHSLGAEGSSMRWMGTAHGRNAPPDLSNAQTLHQSMAGLSLGGSAGVGGPWQLPAAARAPGMQYGFMPLPPQHISPAPAAASSYGAAAYGPGGFTDPTLAAGPYGGMDAMFGHAAAHQGTPQDDLFKYMSTTGGNAAGYAVVDYSEIVSGGVPSGNFSTAPAANPYINSSYSLLVGANRGAGMNQMMGGQQGSGGIVNALAQQPSLGTSSLGSGGLPEIAFSAHSPKNSAAMAAMQLLSGGSYALPQQQHWQPDTDHPQA